MQHVLSEWDPQTSAAVLSMDQQSFCQIVRHFQEPEGNVAAGRSFPSKLSHGARGGQAANGGINSTWALGG